MSDEKNTAVAKVEATAYPLKEQKGNLVAFASITVADCVAIRGVKVLEGKDGLFVGMPSASDGKGGYKDIAFPTSGEMRTAVHTAVLDAYKEARIQALEKSLSGQLKTGVEKSAATPIKEQPAQSRSGDAR